MSNHTEEKGGDSFSVVHTQSDIIIIIIIEKRALEQTQRQREQIPRRNLPRSNQSKSNAFNLTATRTEPNASRTPFPSRRINARVQRKKKFTQVAKREEKFKRNIPQFATTRRRTGRRE